MKVIREITKKEAAVKELCKRLSSDVYSNAIFDYEVISNIVATAPDVIVITGYFTDFRISVCYTILNNDSPVLVSDIVKEIDNNILKIFKK